MTSPRVKSEGRLGRPFDLDVWRYRVDRRRARLVERGYTEGYALERMSRELNAVKNLSTLVEWCGRRGLQVIFAKHENGTYDECACTITIAANASIEKQVFYLIHECGHHLISQHPGDPNRFLAGYNQIDSHVVRTFQHRLACLEEEMEAWQRGRNLAKKLNLKLDEEALEKLRVHCLRTYVNWASKKK